MSRETEMAGESSFGSMVRHLNHGHAIYRKEETGTVKA